MGSQIGCEYAIGGHTVTFAARDPVAARRRVDDALELAERLELLSAHPLDEVRSRTTVAAELELTCDLAVESLPEDLPLKVAQLRPVAAASPGAVLATNTSSLSIGDLGAALDAPERTIGTHYWNPPLLMPLVEVIAGSARADVVERTLSALTALGKRPVLVEQDVPGFVWNRLQLAVMREALWLVENGVVSPETVDLVVRDGLARRWRHVGPFEAAALGGADTWRRIGANLLPVLSDAADLDGLERWLSQDAEALKAVRERRDAALAAELGDRNE